MAGEFASECDEYHTYSRFAGQLSGQGALSYNSLIAMLLYYSRYHSYSTSQIMGWLTFICKPVEWNKALRNAGNHTVNP